MAVKSKLKPCPYCGAMPELGYISSIDKYFYSCPNDKCPCTPLTYAHKNKSVVGSAGKEHNRLLVGFKSGSKPPNPKPTKSLRRG